MRLIGKIEGEEKAYQLYSFLQEEGIQCRYDLCSKEGDIYEFWAQHEDEIEMATHWLKEFQKDPNDLRFQLKSHPIDTEGVKADQEERQEAAMRILKMRQSKRARLPITRLIIIVCIILFIWNQTQTEEAVQGTMTPLLEHLSYDVPDISSSSIWLGLYHVLLDWPQSESELEAPLFIRLKEGELWRLFTPCLLHGSFFHILFNMLWLWMLGRQVEERLRGWQYLTISLLIGIVSNTMQYLMSGPLFIGYSGVICGLAGFIWVRQRCAPWEGYPVPRGTLIFLGVFVVGMFILQAASFLLSRFQIADLPMNIANTAHITGALTGALLAKIPLFSKGEL